MVQEWNPVGLHAVTVSQPTGLQFHVEFFKQTW